MDRRTFLATAATSFAATGTIPATVEPRRPFLTSDIGPLKRVLVHTPGPEVLKIIALEGGDHPLFLGDLIEGEVPERHRVFVDLLTAAGTSVVSLETVLNEAVQAARAAGQLGPWLQTEAPQLAPFEPEITAAVLLGSVDRFVYHFDNQGDFRPLTLPLRWMFFTRDIATMTPQGLILGNLVNKDRTFETALIRLAFTWSPSLRGYPILFDAPAEKVYVQGGDLIVADENLLLVGVGNLTEERVAPLLARKLNMDVLAVQMPNAGNFKRRSIADFWNGLRKQFLHLDTIFNLVDTRKAVALPYFLEAESVGRDPLTSILRGLGQGTGPDALYLEKIRGILRQVGLLKLYRAGSATLDESISRLKLVDYMKKQGYQIIPIGGHPSTASEAHYMVEHVWREVRFQGGNVVATAPGRVIAYAENFHTLKALRAAGIAVETFASRGLAHWHGGPHCMTLPLERA